MDTQKYKALLCAIELGSFSAAAEQLGYTPSGISHMADAVEGWLGLTLLQRGRSGVSLTHSGELLLPMLRDLVHLETLLQQQAADLRGLTSGKLTIGSYSSISAHSLPQVLYAFQQDYTGITIRLMEGVHQELEDWLADYLVDFCLFS